MESNLQSATPINSRKRPRENETEGQRLKREKAAERQRRKRERDRNINAGISVISQFPPPVDHQHLQQQQQHQVYHSPPPPISHPVPIPQPTQPLYSSHDLSPEEKTRRDRVRAAARERQRKHRLLVKQRKMRDLGLDMGNEIPGMEDAQYRVNADGQYQQVMPHEMQQHPPQHPPPQGGDISFPQGQLGGQTFASTLLLSFSCAPLLKAHLMRTLHMNNEELASLEPVLAEAWERWDLARRTHYAEAVKAGIPVAPPGAGSYAIEIPQDPPPGTYGMPPGAPNGPNSIDASSNEFRARFHRSLAAPTPFRTFAPASASAAEAQQQHQQHQQATSTPTSVTSDPIDPHLNASSTATTTGTGKAKAAKSEKS